MASTAISTFFAYNQPAETRRCGEVYCSQTLENFSISCTKCSQEFNLLSCSLFIKHIKQCQSEETSVPNVPPIKEISDIENELKDVFSNSRTEEMYCAAADTQVGDPLMALKEEDVKHTDEILDSEEDEMMDQDDEYLSDFQNEDDLPIEKLSHRRITDEIISEYKKHPVLWQNTHQDSHGKRMAKKHVYKKIRKSINSKFKTNFSDDEMRGRIQNIRFAYRRVLKRKEEFEKRFAGTCGMRFNPQLWYFDKLSFIDDAEDETDQANKSDSDLAEGEASEKDSETSDTDDDYQFVKGKPRDKRERPPCKVLSEPDVITDIISQYKEYPFLWDQTASLYNDKYARKAAFRKITAFINKKFNKNVTDKELRQQIVNLRSGYRRAQRKKHRANYRISLWYYDDLSFIDGKPLENNSGLPVAPKIENLTPPEETTIKFENPPNNQGVEVVQKYEVAEEGTAGDDRDNVGNDDNDDNCKDEAEDQSCHSGNDKLMIASLIEEYKQHPCLWDNYLYKTSTRFTRHDAITEITNTINAKFNRSFTVDDIRTKLVQLRSSYRRVLRNKEAFEKKHANEDMKFHPQLWYFERFTFIGAKDSDFSVSRQRKPKANIENMCYETNVEMEMEVEKQEETEQEGESQKDETAMSVENEEDSINNDDFALQENSESEEKSDDEDALSNRESLTKNKELTIAIIEEYKKTPFLWAAQHFTNNDNHTRTESFGEMAKIINARFNTKYTAKDLSKEVAKLRSAYRRVLRRQRKHPQFKTTIWYAHMLSFIDDTTVVDNVDTLNYAERPESPQSPALDENETYQRKNKLKAKEHVFEIIDLYKSAPILWDRNHPQHTLRSEKKKSIDKILAILKEKYDCHLAIEEFRYQIRFLRESYFRAVRQEANAKRSHGCKYVYKPFFYEQMSFLEPFADKNPVTAPELQVSAADTEPAEDFTFLTENKTLMVSFIELYKKNGCLWDQKHKKRNNEAAHTAAYKKIIKLFREHDLIFTKEKVLSAINFLHSTVVNMQKAFELYDTNNSSEEPVWFYEHLQFLGKIPRIKDKYCTHCDQHFRSLTAYEKHKIEIAGDYPYKCTVCNAGFVSRSKYAYHQITHKEPHKCQVCDFQAFDKHNFNVHMRRHKGIYPFRCDHCTKGFVTSTELNRHRRLHTGERKFICDICGKALATNSEFHEHMKRHRNQRDYKCELCEGAFYTPKALRDHMASHSAERQHVCEVCGAAFKRKKTLLQHKALHMKNKKHECRICGKMFAQKAGLYSHMKSHTLLAGS